MTARLRSKPDIPSAKLHDGILERVSSFQGFEERLHLFICADGDADALSREWPGKIPDEYVLRFEVGEDFRGGCAGGRLREYEVRFAEIGRAHV